MFLSSSRYRNEPSPTSGGPSVVSNRKPIYGTRYNVYTSKEGDSFDLLAMRTLGNPAKWWVIADLNPHVPFPDEIPMGTFIRLPRP